MKRIDVRSIDEVQVIQVIKITSLIGEGTEKDPCRYLYSYFDQEGNLLAVRDSANEL